MRVIVDTSVWSLALRRKKKSEGTAVQKLHTLIAHGERIFLPGLILQELLQGIQQASQVQKLIHTMEGFPLLEPTREDYVAAAELRNLCNQKGVQAGTIDFLIAALCLKYDCRLLTSDNDFVRIAKHCKLQLL